TRQAPSGRSSGSGPPACPPPRPSRSRYTGSPAAMLRGMHSWFLSPSQLSQDGWHKMDAARIASSCDHRSLVRLPMQTPWQEGLIQPSFHTFVKQHRLGRSGSLRALPAIAASGLDDERILHVAAQFAPDALGLQEVLNGFRAVQPAKAAVLETAEWRVEGQRAVGVDPDRSGLQFPRHQVTAADVAGPHAGGETERGAVCQFQ